MEFRKFLSFFSCVGAISFSLSSIASSVGPYDKAPEFLRAHAGSVRIDGGRNFEDSDPNDLSGSDSTNKARAKKSIAESQDDKINKDTPTSSSEQKKKSVGKIALVSCLAISSVIFIGIVAVSYMRCLGRAILCVTM